MADTDTDADAAGASSADATTTTTATTTAAPTAAAAAAAAASTTSAPPRPDPAKKPALTPRKPAATAATSLSASPDPAAGAPTLNVKGSASVGSTTPQDLLATRPSAFQRLLAREARYMQTLDQLCSLYISKIELNDTPWKMGFNSDPDVVLLFTTVKGIAELTKTLSERIAALGREDGSEVAESAAQLPTAEALAALGALYESNATLFQRYLTLYTIFTNVQERLDRLTIGSPDFIAFQCGVQQRVLGTVTFEEYLGRPVLHITTYAQSLARLRDEVAAAGIGRGGGSELQGALDMFHSIIDGLALAKDEIVHRRQIEKLVAERFTGKPRLVEKGRRLVFEGPLDKVSRSRTHQYYFHLFSDLLTYSEQSAGRFTLHRKIDLHVCEAVDTGQQQQQDQDGGAGVGSDGSSAAVANPRAFEIKSAEKSFQVLASDAATKRLWLQKIGECVAELRRQKGMSEHSTATVAATWQSDHAATSCRLCDRAFTTFLRRHHCRKCGSVVCDDCSRHRIWLTNVDSKTQVRVCDDCKKRQDLEAAQLFRLELLVKKTSFLGLSKPCNLFVKAFLLQVHRQKRKTAHCDRRACTATGEASWAGPASKVPRYQHVVVTSKQRRLADAKPQAEATAATAVASTSTPVAGQTGAPQQSSAGAAVGESAEAQMSVDSTNEALVFPGPRGTLLEFFADRHCEELVVELWEKSALGTGKSFCGACSVSFSSQGKRGGGALAALMPDTIDANTRLGWWAFSKKLKPRSSQDAATARACNLEFELRVLPPYAFERVPSSMLRIAEFHRKEALKVKETLGLASTLLLYRRLQKHVADCMPRPALLRRGGRGAQGTSANFLAARCVKFLVPPLGDDVEDDNPGARARLSMKGSGIGATTSVQVVDPKTLIYGVWALKQVLQAAGGRLEDFLHLPRSCEGESAAPLVPSSLGTDGDGDGGVAKQSGPPPLPSRDSLDLRLAKLGIPAAVGSPAPLCGSFLSAAAVAALQTAAEELELEYARARQRDALHNASLSLARFPALTPLVYEVDVRSLTPRQRVIHEIFTSEKSYLDALFTLHQVYAQPLQRAADGLRLTARAAGAVGASGARGRTKGTKKASSEVRKEQRKMLQTPELKVLLSSIDAIVETNSQLMRSLLDALNPSWTPPINVGGVFSSLGHFFKQYDTFAAAHHKAVECLSSSAFKEFVLKCRNSIDDDNGAGSGGGADFKTLLIGPVQRVMRYRMLLQSLAEHTEPDHPDAQELQAALRTINTACDHVNEHVRATENKEKIMEVANKITGLPAGFSMLKEGRVLIKEGVLSKVCRKTNKPFHVVLCNDVLLYGSRYTHGFGQARGERICFHRLVYVADSSFGRSHISDPNAFCIYTTPKSFVLVADTAYEKQQWVEKLEEVFGAPPSDGGGEIELSDDDDDSNSNSNSNGPRSADRSAGRSAPPTPETSRKVRSGSVEHHAQIWEPDHTAKACLACGKKFSFIKRRHHCRQCGKVICGSCSKSTKLLPHIDASVPQRVCDICVAE